MKQIDISKYRILVTNDDSVYAQGISVLEEIAHQLSDDVWVVAPATEQSGAGHSLTLHEPLRYRKIDERHFAVSGTPTDSVLMGVMEIMSDKRPDLILSGINRGHNVAEDVTYSGTIAAAMEGALLDIPSISLSNHRQGNKLNWETPSHFAPDLIRKLINIGWPRNNLININFPYANKDEVKGIKICPQGRRVIDNKLDKRQDPKGRDYFWIDGPGKAQFKAHPGTDYIKLLEGYITVTPICLDLTDYKALEDIEKKIPLKRLAKPKEIAKAIEFLISPSNTYMTGSAIDINGGQFLSS